MYLLIPGRHHVVTHFQAAYLFRFFNAGLDGEVDTKGAALTGRPERAIFAVTSADHAATRRNPVPFFLRAMALHELGSELGIDLSVYGIPEAGDRPDFAEYTLKTLRHDSGGELDLKPDNTLLVCATGVAGLYEALGFRVWAAERSDPTSMPWNLVERIAQSPDWRHDRTVLDALHPASYRLLVRYGLDASIRRIFSDPLLGADGDLTATRDYGAYVRQMDENIIEKWRDTRAFVRPGRIGDIGCAVGSWLQQASRDPLLVNSDFYGIEITRALYDICVQRRHNGDFGTPNIWFTQRNAVEGEVFQTGSMTTIHSSSLTHEIESYAGRDSLRSFIRNRLRELDDGGIWINRDVIGPEEGDGMVQLDLCLTDGAETPGVADIEADSPAVLAALRAERGRRAAERGLCAWLATLSTAERFLVFADDFRGEEGYALPYSFAASPSAGWMRVILSRRDAAEYLLTKDYVDNWQSEMHETFCFWALSDWRRELESMGFSVDGESRVWTNPWILERRWLGKAALYDLSGNIEPWPPTNVLLLARKE